MRLGGQKRPINVDKASNKMTAHFLAPLSTVFAFPSSRFTHAPQANSCCEAGEKDNKLENIKSTELIVHLGATSHRLARVRAQPDVDVDVFGKGELEAQGLGLLGLTHWHTFSPLTQALAHTHTQHGIRALPFHMARSHIEPIYYWK